MQARRPHQRKRAAVAVLRPAEEPEAESPAEEEKQEADPLVSCVLGRPQTLCLSLFCFRRAPATGR